MLARAYDTGVKDVGQVLAAQSATTTGADLLEQAADYLDQYAQFIRDDVKADDLERHPYVPAIDQTATELRALSARNLTDGGEK
ncbi:hypothetical protein [Sphingomonas sp.]|uniref:hypothetical protein n=1 Tax=Sphingomonas sp. TaxID=28214 RepID=UPI0025E92053|nr:hypothetical protein [Sphingomonas sp.]